MRLIRCIGFSGCLFSQISSGIDALRSRKRGHSRFKRNFNARPVYFSSSSLLNTVHGIGATYKIHFVFSQERSRGNGKNELTPARGNFPLAIEVTPCFPLSPNGLFCVSKNLIAHSISGVRVDLLLRCIDI